ncbi:DUF481 domain-containing protein [Dyella subtropica]|uniref:DUF481 domain-containing protein n=1 Tax=Dyella subtropica TaxID=2992127 RepID=UPI00225AC260|nr:DUF481 domain-containing protein [Dyella subtropica]
MRKVLIAGLLLAGFASVAAQAQDATTTTTTTDPASNAADNGGWSGSGEFGFASAHGNSRTENVNAKLGLNQENELWKNNFFLNGMRSKGEVKVVDSTGAQINKFSTTANRYDTGASVGYKLDPRSYIVGAARYEHDDFGANLWQGIVSIGYGYIALKTERTELSFEAGPGYKRYRPADHVVLVNGVKETLHQDSQSEVVGRGLVNYKYRITDNTAAEDTLLVEAGSKNKYYQNDIGLSVSMTKKMALKVGYQIRYNSDVQPGTKSTDTLMTTNLVYNF